MARLVRRGLAATLILGSPVTHIVAAAQTIGAGRAFDLAEVHPSAPNTIPEMRIRFARGRYELRNATLVDLIRTAWGMEAGDVVGGPDWLDLNRFDVIATAPAGTTAETLKNMLRELLKDRFQLSVRSGEKDEPAYEITAGKKPNLKPADGSEAAGCSAQPGANPSPPPRGAAAELVAFACLNMTMTAFAKALPSIRESPTRPDPAASGYLFNYPVLDRTGLKGAWNFSFKWSPRHSLLTSPSAGETITIFDAFTKQLGLNLKLTKIPKPVIVVDNAQKPQVAESPRTPMAFEVADIRPESPNDPVLPCGNINIQPGGLVRINMSLKGLILETQGELNSHRIVGGPKSMDATCWLILAKAPVQEDAVAGWNGPLWNGVDIDSMRQMLRSLLEDRFKLVVHTEDRPVSGYALEAVKPKLLRKADPSNRPGCKEGPGADGKDPRLANPLASRLVTCRNMTLSQFASELNHLSIGAGGPVVDSTGIDGRFDMTVNFSPPSALPNAGQPNAGGDPVASEPNGAISIFEALSKQLGLHLKAREVPAPVLVVDHLEEKPTEN